MNRACLTALMVCLGVGVFSAVVAAEEKKLSTNAEREAEERTRKIKAEIQGLDDHPWAGKYFVSDGLGANISLVLAPKAGYVFEWHGCLGTYDRNYGGVAEENGRIQLSFTFPNEEVGFQGISPEFVPVAWGPRRYLIPPKRMISFCNYVNAGLEPRDSGLGLHLLREGDEKKEVGGAPAVPAEYVPCLLKEPIASEIVSIGRSTKSRGPSDRKHRDVAVTVKGGKRAGHFVGMELYVIDPPNAYGSVEITEVRDDVSEGVVARVGESNTMPSVRWRLSSRRRSVLGEDSKSP